MVTILVDHFISVRKNLFNLKINSTPLYRSHVPKSIRSVDTWQTKTPNPSLGINDKVSQ